MLNQSCWSLHALAAQMMWCDRFGLRAFSLTHMVYRDTQRALKQQTLVTHYCSSVRRNGDFTNWFKLYSPSVEDLKRKNGRIFQLNEVDENKH